jgi:phenylacetic acid degradation operon negative regulatory protein
VVFDIPQKKARLRDVLRKKLKELGFGMLQESIWISPHDFVDDLREFLEASGLSEMVFVLEAKNIAGIPNKEIAVQIFHLDEVNEAYENLLQEHDKLLRSGKDAASVLRSTYLEILLRDPMMPKAFLPDNWFGEQARRMMLSEIK